MDLGALPLIANARTRSISTEKGKGCIAVHVKFSALRSRIPRPHLQPS